MGDFAVIIVVLIGAVTLIALLSDASWIGEVFLIPIRAIGQGIIVVFEALGQILINVVDWVLEGGFLIFIQNLISLIQSIIT